MNVSTKAKKRVSRKKQPTEPYRWWEHLPKLPTTNPDFPSEYAAAERLLNSYMTLEQMQVERQKEVDEANRQFDLLAEELAEQEAERKRLWGNRYPRVLGQKPGEEDGKRRRRPTSKSKPPSRLEILPVQKRNVK